MEQRQEDFDYDMTVTRLVLPLSPSVELRSIFGSQSLDEPGSFNLSGLADPVVDDMIDQAIRADSREQLDARVRALDRVLRSKHIWVPNWFKGAHWIAYWDVFGKPDKKPAYARGDDYWWFDQTKFDDLKAQGALR
jgi:microcin C transport system substrate-binding protein